MKTSPKFIFFTDFDGTITLRDSNDYLTDNVGFGFEKRRQGNRDVLEEKDSFRDSFQKMMDSVTLPYDQCIDLLVKNIKLDPGFNDFFQWALTKNIPVVVLSSGMTPIIRAILANLVGPDADKIDVVCNDVRPRKGKTSINEPGGWEIVFHDDSHFGHDKSLTIKPYRQLPADKRPTLFYAGDGVSDLSAARETDLLFAKKGHDLIDYCVKEDVPFTVFEDWTSIHQGVRDIVEGKTTVQDAAEEGHRLYKEGKAK
ncbi:hypothetical protein ANO11243_081690 [Dothideomycetidae sp. 11243]|nr:hypothetical protein ANO11243_081690 [fungal sp. No.11243]